MDDSDIVEGLNAAQVEAVRHVDGPMLVVAGAGSGKTRVVTRRIARLVRMGVAPWRILALTFTNKAAGEMRERVEQLTGQAPTWMGTFHSVCARILRLDMDKLPGGRDARYSIADTADQERVVKDVAKDMSLDDKRHRPRTLLSRISRAKSDFKTPAEFDEGLFDSDLVRVVYDRYERRLAAMNAVDFDDLLVLAVRLLEGNAEARERWRRRFRYLLVDEYQDTNHAQYRLLKTLAGDDANLHATGDPDQSIYSWRGADYSNIMDFQRDYPGARLVRLEDNYRSTEAILEAANELIRHNVHRIDKDLRAQHPGGVPIRSAMLPTETDEGEWIVRQAVRERDRLAEPRTSAASEGDAPPPPGRRAWRDMAVFYRTNAQSRALEESFLRSGVPYQIVGGLRFYERREVKDLLANLRVLVNPRDDASLDRLVAARPVGVGQKTLDKIRVRAEALGVSAFELLASDQLSAVPGVNAKAMAFGQFCRRLAGVDLRRADLAVKEVLALSGLVEHWLNQSEQDESGDDRVENLHALAARAADFVVRRVNGAASLGARTDADGEGDPEAMRGTGIDLAAFLEDVALVADVDQWDRGADRISLMTLHSAKGLEFPVVFVAGLEEGLLPHKNADTEAAREEERRLLYVGLTRAREVGYVTLTRTRYQYGTTDYAMPSLFLNEFHHVCAGGGSLPAPGATLDVADRAKPSGPADDPFGDDGVVAALDDDAVPDAWPDADDFVDGSPEDGDEAFAPTRRLGRRPVAIKPVPAWKAALEKSIADLARQRQLRAAGGGKAGGADGNGDGARGIAAGDSRSPGGRRAAVVERGPALVDAAGVGGEDAAFTPGQRVRHPVLGRGVVVEAHGMHVVVRFAVGGVKTLHRAHCRLTAEA